MAGLEWAFKLRDQVTQPAGSIANQLRSVSFALKTLDLASKQARLERLTDPLKKTRLELQIHRDKLMLSKRAIDEHTGSSKKWTDQIVRWAGTLYIFDLVARGFRAVARAAVDMGSQIKDAVETQQRGLFGLRSTMGNRAGGDFFRQLQAQAQAYGRPSGEVTGLGAGFNTAGASPDFARKLVGAVYDVRTASGGKSDITQQLQNILTSPVLDVGNLTSFGGALDLKKLWAAFGKRMRMRPGDAEQVLAGRIPGQYVAGGEGSPLLQAVFDQIAGMPGGRGGVGNIARGFADTQLEGGLGRLKTSIEQLFGSVENSQGLKTLNSVLQNMARTLGGNDMRGALRDLVDSMGQILQPLQGAGGQQRMREFFSLIVKLAKDAAEGMGALARSFLGLLQIAGVGSDVLNILRGKPPTALTPETQALFSGFFGRGVVVNEDTQRRLSLPRQPSPYQQFSAPININIDGRSPLNPEGLRIAVEREIARQRADSDTTTVNDAFEKLGVQVGGF